MGSAFDREFKDEGISGGVMAADRPGFAELLKQVRPGDVIHVYAVDRLGRDALDVQSTVRRLVDLGVSVDVRGIGTIGKGVGEIVLAVLAQVADLERERIRTRTADGRAKARASIAETGRTHHGKISLGRPQAAEAPQVIDWRQRNSASITQTASHFKISAATVKRYAAQVLRA
jgi:putative DNA-invertase from lambdoid prophage Rac